MKRFDHILAEVLSWCFSLSAEEVLEHIEAPPKLEMGDYALPCFGLAKKLRQDPKKIAADLAAKADLSSTPFASVEPAGPYLNFRLSDTELARSVLTAIYEEGRAFGTSEAGKGERVIVDYSSPNIAKPFHIGHLRSTVIGAALYRLYKALGYEPVGINHLGDWGTQFGMVMAAFSESGSEHELIRRPIAYSLELYVSYNRRCEQDPAARDKARQWFRRLEEGEPEAVELWRKFRDLSLQKFEKIYERLGVRFDYYTGESFYNDRMEDALSRAESSGALSSGEDGARMVRLDEHGMPPFIMVKSDGATLYATREVAAALYRYETFAPRLMLYVVGTPQELHFKQLVESLLKMGFEWAERVVHVKFGHVHGMSTRKGEVVLLEDVLDEAGAKAREKIEDNVRAGKLDPEVDRDQLAEAVGIGSIIAHDLKHRRERDIIFDWDQVLQFDGETGPYLQYSYARIRGILRKAGAEPAPDVDFTCLCEPETRALLRKLADFPAVVESAVSDNEPSYLTTYLFELTRAFNIFYNQHRVVGSGEPYESARLLLVACTGQVLKTALELLGIPVLERM
ncbi:MAG: arginine--tRNA ligase [bacterium]